MNILNSVRKRLRKRADRRYRRSAIREAIARLEVPLRVRHGPFQGLQYPQAQSHGSSLYPKLLGSYESELHGVLERLLGSTAYNAFVDVGCAEGYYAVGFALRQPAAKVFAFDISAQARTYCRQLAEQNGIGREQLQIGAACSPETLQSLPLGERALIFCDCEGYEKRLFEPAVIGALDQHDVIVETHDLLDIEISSELARRFEPTHDLEWIASIDDIQKAKWYRFDELAGHDLQTRRVLLAEGRSATMEWMVARARRQPSIEND